MDYDKYSDPNVDFAPAASARSVQTGSINYDKYSDPEVDFAPAEMSGLDQAKAAVDRNRWLTDRLTLGAASITKASQGFALANSNRTFEDARSAFETDALKQAQLETEEDRAQHNLGIVGGLPIGQSDVFGGYLLEQVPALTAMGGGAAVGAGAVALFSGPVGWGALGGAALVGGALAGGEMIYDLMEKGVDRDMARGAGIWTGVANAVLMGAGGAAWGKGMEAALQAAFKSSSLKNAMPNLIKHVGMSYGVQLGTAEIAAIQGGVLEYFARNNSEDAEPMTLKELQSELTQATVQAAIVSGQMAGAGTAIGASAGSLARAARLERLKMQRANRTVEKVVTGRVVSEPTPEELAAGQIRAKKKSAKFSNVSQAEAADVKQAQIDLDDAIAAHEVAQTDVGRTLAKSDVDHARNVLKEAKYQAQLREVEGALTDLDLKASVEVRRDEVKVRLQANEDAIKAAQHAGAPDDVLKRMYQAASDLREEDRMLSDFAKLDPDALKEKLTEMKGEIQEKADKLKRHMATTTIKGRISAREREMKQLQDEIDSGLAPLPAQPGAAAPPDPAVERMVRLRADHELDQLTLELIEEKGVTPAEVDALASRANRTPIARLNGIIKMAGDRIEKAAKLGADDQRKTAKAVRQILGRVVELARLPKEDKLKLQKSLQDAATPDDLMAAFEPLKAEIEEQFKARQHEAAVQDLKNTMDSFKVRKQNESKYPGQEEAITATLQLLKDPDNVEKVRADIAAKQANNVALDPREEALNDALNTLFPDNKAYKDMPTPQVVAIVEALADLKTKGKHAAFERSQTRKAEAQADVSYFMDAATKRLSGKAVSENRVAGPVEQKWSEFDATWKPWDELMQFITKHGKVDKLTSIFDLRDAENKFSKTYREGAEAMKDSINKAVKDSDWLRYRIEWDAYGPAVYFAVTKDDGTLGLRRIVRIGNKVKVVDGNAPMQKNWKNPTIMDDIQIRNYLKDADPDAKSRLSKGNGFNYKGETEAGMSAQERIESALYGFNPDTLKVADALLEWYQWFYPTVDAVSFKRFGRHLPNNRTYGGELLSDMSPENRFREVTRRATTRPGSVLARQGGSEPVLIKGALENAINHLHRFSREQAYFDFERRAKTLFGEALVKDFIENNFGAKTVKVVDKFVEDLINGHYQVYSAASDTFGWIRRMAFARYLGLKGEQYIKQLTGAVYALQSVGPKAVVEAYAELKADPKKWIALMNESEALKRRGTKIDPDFQANGVPLFLLPSVVKLMAKGQVRKGANILLETAEHNAMRALEKGDMHGVYLSSFPVLWKTLKETGSKQKALAAFEEAFTRTQSSGELREMPAMFRGNMLERMLTIFAQQPTKQLAIVGAAIDECRANPTKATALKAAQVITTSWLGAASYNMTGAMIAAAMRPDDADKILRTATAVSFLGPLAGFGVLGNTLVYAELLLSSSTLDESFNIHRPGFLLTDFLGDAMDSAAKYVKLKEDLDAIHVWDALLSTYKLIGPVPTGAKELTKAALKDNE